MITVVTGATGHVGANLVRALVNQGRTVRAMVHVDRRAVEGLDLEIVKGDVCDLDSLCRAFEGAEVVYHLATYISLLMNEWPHCTSVNVTGVQNVVEACVRTGVRRLVHFSSIHALEQRPKDSPVDETRPLVKSHRCPPYDRSKADGEREVHRGIERGLDAIIIRPTGIIGPYDYKPSYFGEVLLSLARGQMPALVDAGFNWVDVRDVINGAMCAEKQAQKGAKYLLSGHWASMQDLAVMVEESIKVTCPSFICPLWLADIGAPFATAFASMTGRRPLYSRVSLMALRGNRNVSHGKATRELDYHPRPLNQTIADTLRWFEESGQLTCCPKKK